MTKKAYLVGINDYTPAGPGGSDLAGCVNDVRDMINTLVICGFPSQSIGVHTDARATKKGIIYGLNWLTSNSKKGDSLVFYYSGHGSQIADTNWNGDEDETDGKDEILCPHDLDWTPNTVLRDDEIRKAFQKIPEGVNLEVFLDCCHSGTATKNVLSPYELPDVNKPLIHETTKTRYLPPPIDYATRIQYEPDLPTRRLLRSECEKETSVITQGLNHSLWSGCRDNQLSTETVIDGQRRGVFTHSLGKILRKTKGAISRKEIYSLLSAAVAKYGFEQNPQLETSSDELYDKPFI